MLHPNLANQLPILLQDLNRLPRSIVEHILSPQSVRHLRRYKLIQYVIQPAFGVDGAEDIGYGGRGGGEGGLVRPPGFPVFDSVRGRGMDETRTGCGGDVGGGKDGSGGGDEGGRSGGGGGGGVEAVGVGRCEKGGTCDGEEHELTSRGKGRREERDAPGNVDNTSKVVPKISSISAQTRSLARMKSLPSSALRTIEYSSVSLAAIATLLGSVQAVVVQTAKAISSPSTPVEARTDERAEEGVWRGKET